MTFCKNVIAIYFLIIDHSLLHIRYIYYIHCWISLQSYKTIMVVCIYQPLFNVQAMWKEIKVGLYGIHQVRILCRSTPAVTLYVEPGGCHGMGFTVSDRQRVAYFLHDTSHWLDYSIVLMCRHWAPAGGRWQWTSAAMATAGLNITAGVERQRILSGRIPYSPTLYTRSNRLNEPTWLVS